MLTIWFLIQWQVQALLSVGVLLEWAGCVNFYIEVTLLEQWSVVTLQNHPTFPLKKTCV